MQNVDILALAGLRIDGRRPGDLRTLKHKLAVVKTADGSAYLEQGLNKVIVMVHGPQEPKRKMADHLADKCNVVCRVLRAPSSGSEWKRRKNVDKRTLEMEQNLCELVEQNVITDTYPRAELSVIVHIMESDGSVFCTVVNALCLALMDAGVAMYDMFSSCSVGAVKNEFCVDITQLEQNAGGAFIPMVVRARTEEVLFLQLDSRLSLDKLETAMEVGVEGCKQMREYLEAAIREGHT